MKAKEVLRALRQRGDVEVPVVGKHDVLYVIVKKQYLIAQFERMEPDEETHYTVTRNPASDLMSLDIA